MSDVAYPSDFLEENRKANALNAAQNRSRIDAIRTQRTNMLNVSARRGSAANGTSGAPIARQAAAHEQKSNAEGSKFQKNFERQEYIEDESLPYQIYLLEQRGKQLKKDAIKDEIAAESMEISNTWVDMVAGSIIEIGKASLEILIGFLILPAGFIIKTVKFFFDRQITSLKASSQKKNKQGDKFLAQAAKLRGKQTAIQRAADAATSAAKNYIAELLAEFFPFGISPLVVFESAKEKQKSLYKILLRAAFFFATIVISLALIVIFIYLVLENVCDKIPLCKPTVKIFGAEIVSKTIAQ